MSKPGSRKSKSIDPQVVISRASGAGGDAALRGFIDDWFVPALVEEYIRQHQVLHNRTGKDVESGRNPGDEHRG